MISIILVSHGPLASGIKETAKMFFGDMVDDVATICLFPSDSPEEFEERIANKIVEIDDGNGVLIFADILNGTPFNMTAMSIEKLKEEHKLECLTGFNLPILMEALAIRMNSETGLKELKDELLSIFPSTMSDVRKELDI